MSNPCAPRPRAWRRGLAGLTRSSEKLRPKGRASSRWEGHFSDSTSPWGRLLPQRTLMHPRLLRRGPKPRKHSYFGIKGSAGLDYFWPCIIVVRTTATTAAATAGIGACCKNESTDAAWGPTTKASSQSAWVGPTTERRSPSASACGPTTETRSPTSKTRSPTSVAGAAADAACRRSSTTAAR